MVDLHHADETQVGSWVRTLHILYAMRETVPAANLVKMGTMAEYGTSTSRSPKGFVDVEYHGRKHRMPIPRPAGSGYYGGNVFDSGDVMFASKIWSLKVADVMQGVISVVRALEITNDRLLTRLDFDESWGTALNRITQAVLGLPFPSYGEGGGKRGFSCSKTRSSRCGSPWRIRRLSVGNVRSTRSTRRTRSTSSPR